MDNIISDIDKLVCSYKNIGIFLSGGFDSAMLSYLAHESRLRLNTSTIFIFFTVPRYDDSVLHAKRIINFIDQTFNNQPTNHYILGNPTLHHSHQVSSGIRKALIDHAYLDIIMTAGNKIPDEIPFGPYRHHPSVHPKLRKPFFNYTKDVIVQLCIYKNLQSIIDLSHTCTESPSIRCNNCWQCRERAWAFKKCNYRDSGIM